MIPRAARGVPPPGAGDRAPCHISRARGGGVGRFGQIRDQRSESCFCRPRRAAARSRRRGRFSPAEPPGAPAEPELRLTAVPPGGGDARDPESLRPWGTAAGSGVPATAWQWQAVPGTGTATVAGTPLASELSRSQRRVRRRSLPPAVQAPALQAAVQAGALPPPLALPGGRASGRGSARAPPARDFRHSSGAPPPPSHLVRPRHPSASAPAASGSRTCRRPRCRRRKISRGGGGRLRVRWLPLALCQPQWLGEVS